MRPPDTEKRRPARNAALREVDLQSTTHSPSVTYEWAACPLHPWVGVSVVDGLCILPIEGFHWVETSRRREVAA